MIARWVWRAVAFGAVGALMAGCAQVVAGTPEVDQDALHEIQAQRAARPLPAAEVLGDLQTLDACSLVDLDQATLPQVGRPSPYFGGCAFSAGAETLQVGNPEPVSAIKPVLRADTSKPRGLRVLQTQNFSTMCTAYLVFTDGVGLMVRLMPQGSSSLGGDCSLVTDAVDALVQVVTQEPRHIRHFDYPANSFGRLDACALVPDDQAAAQLGVPAARAPSPDKHGCRWGVDDFRGPNATFGFSVATGSTTDLPGRAKETIGGRPSQVDTAINAGDFVMCDVRTAHIPFVGGGTEGADLHVTVPASSGKDPCAIARNLAAVAWPQLPPV